MAAPVAADGVLFEPGILPPADGKVCGLVMVDKSGSRKIVAQNRPDRDWVKIRDWALRKVSEGYPVYACMFGHSSWGYTLSSDENIYEGPVRFVNGKFFTYDYGYQDDPVNQIPYLLEWREMVSRFAHEHDVWHMSRTRRDTALETQAVVDKLVISLIGHVWKNLNTWAAWNPQTVTVWADALPLIRTYMGYLCDTCEIFNYTRQLLRNINPVVFREKFDLGELWHVDRTTTPWGLAGTAPIARAPTPATPPVDNGAGGSSGSSGAAKPSPPTLEMAIMDFFNDLETEYKAAIQYYDEEVGHAESPHSH